RSRASRSAMLGCVATCRWRLMPPGYERRQAIRITAWPVSALTGSRVMPIHLGSVLQQRTGLLGTSPLACVLGTYRRCWRRRTVPRNAPQDIYLGHAYLPPLVQGLRYGMHCFYGKWGQAS